MYNKYKEQISNETFNRAPLNMNTGHTLYNYISRLSRLLMLLIYAKSAKIYLHES